MSNFEYLLSKLDAINGIGIKTLNLFKKKNINNIFELLWHLPNSKIITSKVDNLNELRIGKIQTINLTPIKYNFPRIKRLPNKVVCINGSNKIECIFFNSYEGYIKKVFPLNVELSLTGKIGYFRNKYQIINPKISDDNSSNLISEKNKYSLTEGLNLNRYNKIIDEVLNNLPNLEEWLSEDILKKFNYVNWKDSIIQIHKGNINEVKNSNFYKRLIFDEVFAHFLISSKIRIKIKKIKKKQKKFVDQKNNIIKNLNFNLTSDQNNAIKVINTDLKSKNRMFRLIQGDVGSGKTIVSIIAGLNTIKSGYQVCMMVPTEILAKQHFNFITSNFGKYCRVELLTGKTEYKKRKEILSDLSNNKIDFIIGTHSLFQKKLNYANLGLIIIDEQHKFGVKQRKELSDKGGKNCDLLVMSATPIPRTMIMTIYGDMDVTFIKEKPKNRKKIKTYSKLEENINEVIKFVKKQLNFGNQIFWVCPLIEESKKLDHQSVLEKFKYLSKYFGDKVGLIHGSIEKDKKNIILNEFLEKKINILVSTTVIEVGIDFPDANLIIIENANKYGLSQLHQLRGRVGRGNKDSYCILMFKSNLSENAKKRINIMKSTTDGFKISEDDMKLRGYGDILGFKQSGIKRFRLADPLLHQDIFKLAETEVKKLENNNSNFNKYNKLLKLYDRASIINEIN